VQGEGGIKVAPLEWWSNLAELYRRHGVVLIVDDGQMGSGRTAVFFSFEPLAPRRTSSACQVHTAVTACRWRSR
jgi:adenosylmethionine-8-amino-7-oxononanoate aminotransferase